MFNSEVREVYVISPSSAGFQGTLDGVPIITQLMGEVRALKGGPPPGRGGNDKNNNDSVKPCDLDSTAKCDRPVPIGVSTGHLLITAGTICCRVKNIIGSAVFALSNNHVYANVNQASIGDEVIQPGPFDLGTVDNLDHVIGYLDDFETLRFGGAPNMIDAAIASTTTALLGNATPSDGYGTPLSTTVSASEALGLRVMKYGRTTGQTKGRIDSINATLNINYGDNRIALFKSQIVITPGNFSAAGDSGSLIVVNDKKSEHNGKPVGLLFAGSFIATIANPIDEVLMRFGVRIDGQ